MVDDPGRRAHWVAEGRKRALDFRWFRTARLTQEVYRNLARESS